MKKSDDRVLTTHVGSLPRSRQLLDLLIRRHANEEFDASEFANIVQRETDAVVAAQIGSGVDVPGNGELSRLGFSFYVKDRMSGFAGESIRGVISDFEKFPGFVELKFGQSPSVAENATIYRMPAAQTAISYDQNLLAAREELRVFAQALESASGTFEESFITAATPGIISTTLLRDPDVSPYASDADYVLALASEMKTEYECFVSAGHVLQLDAPDLAFERALMFAGRPTIEFLDRVELHIEAMNLAIANIPTDRVRLHVCWGNGDWPHVDDIELKELLHILYRAKVGGLSLPFANPRHQHEWKLLKAYPPPDDIVILPGVVDVTTNYVEHPEVVADRICQVAEALGDRTRVIASTDCGFSTFAGGHPMVADDVVWAKLETLSHGARLATQRLWS